MLTRRSLLRRAVGALAAGTLAGVSRWLPAPHPEGELLPVPDFSKVRDWRWHHETAVLTVPPPSYVNSLADLLDKELEQLTRDVMNGCGRSW